MIKLMTDTQQDIMEVIKANPILIPFLVLAAVMVFFFIITMFMKVSSVRNGEELAEKYRYAADGSVVRAKGVIFWPSFRLLLQGKDRQVLPLFAGKFRRLYFANETIYYSMMGDFKHTRRGKFYLTYFSNGLGRIAFFIGAGLAVLGYLNPNENMGQTQIAQYGLLVIGCTTALIGLGIFLLPSFNMVKYALPVVRKMSISDEDKRKISFVVKFNFVIAIIGLILDVIQFIMKAQEQKNRR